VIVLDTHAWVWFAAETGRLSRVASAAIRRADRLAVHPVSCWEVVRLVERGRLRLTMDAARWVREAMRLPRVEALPFTPDAAVRAAQFGETFAADPADRFIVASALEAGLPVVTRDERIAAFPGVRVIW
jgi:PIN domain nuclease of toxin-antitoxin system